MLQWRRLSGGRDCVEIDTTRAVEENVEAVMAAWRLFAIC